MAGADTGEPSEAGAGGEPASPRPVYGAPTLDKPCENDTELACAGPAQKQRLRCEDGTWRDNGVCSAQQNCDQTGGSCQDVVAECAGKQPNSKICVGDSVQRCGPDLVSIEELTACDGKCVSVNDGADCAPKSCGDGKTQAPEECDDGNDVNTDACTNACKNAVCGDGAKWEGHEQCDDGNAVATDDCNACKVPSCGDGSTWAGHEECDDGNAIKTDDCNGCKLPTCGDGATWAGHEDCDDQNSVKTDDCNACKAPTCGDGAAWTAHEACDDGNAVNVDACTNGCVLPVRTWTLWPMPNPVASGLPNPHSYDLSSSLVAKDNVTGLTWQRSYRTFVTFSQSIAYCEALDLGGSTDWRVPTRIELASLIDYSRTQAPLIDVTAFPGVATSEVFWSSTPHIFNAVSLWALQCFDGTMQGVDNGNDLPLAVRCVH